MGRRAFGTITVGVLLAAASLTSAACEIRAGEGDFSLEFASGKASDTWTRTYQLPPGGRIEIINTNGEIVAEAAPDGPVEVHAARTVKATSDDAAREMLAKVEMREEAGPTRVRIEAIGPRLRMGGLTARFVVRVPPGVHVDLRTVNGGVRLDNVGGEVRATTTNGGVRGRLAAVSLLDARTTNGGVELEVSGPVSADARVTLTSVNGGVKLKVPGDTRATLTARCVNGRVSVTDLDVTDDEGADSRRRRLQGTLNGGGARIELQTTNGGVAIGRS